MAILDILAPYKRAAEVVVILAAAAGVAYEFHEFCDRQQQVGYNRAVAEQAKVDEVRNSAQAQLETQLAKRVEDAEGKANDREQIQKSVNLAVSASADRLQRAIDQVRASNGTASVDALRAANTTLTTVFQDCAGRYRELGKTADGHASDVQTLIDAWPVAPPPADAQQK